MSLLKACSRPTFQDRRDTALVRILIDTGIRVSGRVMLKRLGVFRLDHSAQPAHAAPRTGPAHRTQAPSLLNLN